jgi:hypothetical protein
MPKKVRQTTRVEDLFLGPESLTRQLSVPQAEAAFAIRLEGYGPDPIPFGFLCPEWERLKAKMRPGDELWEFEGYWPRGDHIRGVKLMRHGKMIDAIGAEMTPPATLSAAQKTPKRRSKK